MRGIQEMLALTRRLPLAAAVDLVLERTGWLALSATTPGGARAGHLLQAIDERARRWWSRAAGWPMPPTRSTEAEQQSTETEALPLESGPAQRRAPHEPAQGQGARGAGRHPRRSAVRLRVPDLHAGRAEGKCGHGASSSRSQEHERLSEATTLAQPAGWEAHEAEEKKYVEAERLRLLYVAGTRAKDLLIVSRSAKAEQNKPWREFEGYLAGVPALKVSLVKPVTRKLEADLSAKARAAAEAGRAARHESAQAATWAVATPTGEKARLAAAERAKQVADDERAAAAVPDTASHRADGGAAWGTLLHGLLEHAMRHRDASREDLARLALWLTVEHEEIRPFISEALDWVDDVRRLPFWQEARAGAEVHVEVPFAVRLTGEPNLVPTVLRGVIDLVLSGRRRVADSGLQERPDRRPGRCGRRIAGALRPAASAVPVCVGACRPWEGVVR